MADVRDGFNYDIDKITERECVFDIISRFHIGYDFTDFNDPDVVIFPADYLFKDILRRMAMALPTTIAHNLQEYNQTYKNVNVGDKTVEVTTKGVLLRAYSERLQMDIKDSFDLISSANNQYTYRMVTDVPYSNEDIIKFYSK